MSEPLTNQQILDDLILHQKLLNDIMLKMIELRELVADIESGIELDDKLNEMTFDKHYALLKWLFKQILRLGEWNVGRDKDGKLRGWVTPKQVRYRGELEKRLTALAEELEGFRIYTLSTLKEIKEQPIKKTERYTIK